MSITIFGTIKTVYRLKYQTKLTANPIIQVKLLNGRLVENETIIASFKKINLPVQTVPSPV